MFIKRNTSLFKQDPFPWKVFKKLKHQFFIEQVKSPVPKDSEMAGDIAEGMIISLQLSTKDQLDKLLELPFFKKSIQNKQYYYERLALKSKQVTPLLDISVIEKAEEMEKIRNEIKDEVRQEFIEKKEEELKEWDEKINQKAEMYFAFPSILDKEEYPLPDIVEGESAERNMFLPWWEELGLVEDPFKELDGLAEIKNYYYKKIVHKTIIFLRYESYVQNSVSELFRNTVIYGDWGSGKTTLFDYLNPILSENRIFPIYIQLSKGLEVHALIFEFQRKVSIELKTLHSILVGTPPSLESLGDEEPMIGLMKNLTYQGAKGFIIIVDDLHKGDIDDAMNFMSYLQVLASQFRRGTGLKIGFIVAGSLDWEDRIKTDDKFTGSVNRQEHMPLINMDIALDAINRRLEAFARNPENPRKIERSFIERIYNRLKYSQDVKKITFRKIMLELLNEFYDGHFDALSANPIKISSETKKGIQKLFEKNSEVAKQFSEFFSNLKDATPLSKRQCLEFLIKVYINNGVVESEIREPDVPYLQRLAGAGLITKIIANETHVWKISKELYSLNKTCIKDYKLSMEDYLFQLFGDRLPEKKKEAKEINQEIFQLDTMLKSMPQDLGLEYLTAAKRVHLKILETEDRYSSNETVTMMNACTKALSLLTRSVIFYMRAQAPAVRDDFALLSFWTDFWWCPESISQFCRAVTSDVAPQKKFPLVLSLYREAFSLILNFFKSEHENSRIFYIPLSLLKDDELKILHECRRRLSNFEYDEALDTMVKFIDRKLRTFLHDIFSLLYGDYENRMKWVDRDTLKQIQLSVGSNFPSGFSPLHNEFMAISKVKFRHIMTGLDESTIGRRNWRCIFGESFSKWQERELYEYLGVLEEFKDTLSAMNDDTAFGNKENYVLTFMKKSIKFMRSINLTYIKLVTSGYLKYDEKAFFSLCNFDDLQTLTPIDIAKEDIDRIIELFKNKNKLRLQLDNQEYLEGFFGMDYRKAYAILSLLHHSFEFGPDKTKACLELVSSNSPEIQVRISTAVSWAVSKHPAEDNSSSSAEAKKKAAPISEAQPKENNIDFRQLAALIESNLRKMVRAKPTKEAEINDALECFFIGAGLDGKFSREKDHIEYSSKTYIPDFVFPEIETAVETKFCDKPEREKEMISEINDDIIAYKTKYPNVIFVIYDVGMIRNMDQFKNHIEKQPAVVVKIVKH